MKRVLTMNPYRFTPRLESLEVRALLNAGALDPTFGIVTTQLQGQDTAQSVALQPDGKIVVAGTSAGEYGIVRYNTDGTLDATFGNRGIVLGQSGELINAIGVAANGNLIASGTANNEAAVFEFNSDGTPSASFGTNGILTLASDPDSGAAGLQLQPDGKIVGLVEDSVSTPANLTLKSVFRLQADGTPDQSFVSPTFPTSFGGPYSLALAPNGQIIVGGLDNQIGTITIYRLNPDGSQDIALVGGTGTLQVSNLAALALHELTVDAQNRILVLAENRANADVLERFNVNGTPDVTFGGQGGDGVGQVIVAPGPGVDSFTSVGSVVVQPDGRLVVAGTSGFTHSVLQSSNPYLARYNPNGTPDTTFGSNGSTGVGVSQSGDERSGAATVALQADGKIVFVGTFFTGSALFGGTDKNLFLTVRLLGDTPSGDANQQLVSRLYLDLLQRPADPGGLAFWSGLLDRGLLTAPQVALGIETSPERHALVVNELYGEYLRRPADPAGLAASSAFLAGGGTVDLLRALLLGSGEYFSISGNTNGAFVNGVYRDVLGRTPDPGGVQQWQGVLSSGVSPLAVAGAIVASPEAVSDEVTALYYWLLHRAPDPTGLQSFSHVLEQGVPVEFVMAVIAGSAEYASRQ
jgi:uncharacterized delta-60 repeat protein